MMLEGWVLTIWSACLPLGWKTVCGIWNGKFFDGKYFKIFKIKIKCLAAQKIQKIKVWLHFSRSCTDAPLNTSVLLSELLSFHLFICHDSLFWVFFPNLEMISNLCTGRPSRPITTIEGFTTARLSSEKVRIRYLIIGKRQIVSIKAVTLRCTMLGLNVKDLNCVMPSAKLKAGLKCTPQENLFWKFSFLCLV